MSGSDALPAALRLLARRGHGEGELGERLRKKGFDEESICTALARCRQLGYLDDLRFAHERARELMRGGRAVGRRVLADLKARGVNEETALAALEEATGEFGEESLLNEVLSRRFPDFIWRSADERQRRRVVDYFLRRGFQLSLVLSFLQQER